MNPLYFTYPLAAIFIFIYAFGLGVVITRRFNLNWRLYWVGALTFVGSQVFHIPFNSIVLQPLIDNGTLLFFPGGIGRTILLAFWFGLSAGLFEELARYLVYARFLPDDRSWKKGVLFGAGHGGIEAIIIGFLILITYFQIRALTGQDLTAVSPGSNASQAVQIQQQINYYWSIPWPLSLLGFVERLFTVPLHIANAVLVLQVFRRNQLRWLWAAVGWHTAVNMLALIFSEQLKSNPYGSYLTEGVIGLTALVSLAIIFVLRTSDPAPASENTVPLPAFKIEPIDETPESLDQSRFNQ